MKSEIRNPTANFETLEWPETNTAQPNCNQGRTKATAEYAKYAEGKTVRDRFSAYSAYSAVVAFRFWLWLRRAAGFCGWFYNRLPKSKFPNGRNPVTGSRVLNFPLFRFGFVSFRPFEIESQMTSTLKEMILPAIILPCRFGPLRGPNFSVSNLSVSISPGSGSARLGFRVSDFGFWLPGFVALAALCGCVPSTAEGPQKASPPVTVQTILPRRGEIARSVTLPTFRILAYQEATLYAKVSGYLKTLTVDKGDAVKEGQLLAEIEVPELLADEAQYQAEASVARTNYERMTEARQKAPDLVVPQAVDDLRGQSEVAQAKLQRIRTLLQYSRIVAPFSGIITARFVDPGAFIPAATAGSTPQSAALVTLMDFTRLRVQVFVPETEVPFIKNGIPAQVRVEELPGRTFQGSVTRFAHALDEATKTMLTEIELPNATGELRPGMYASVQLEVERKRDALLVPAQALAVEKAGSFVFLVADGKAKKTPVHTGFNDGVNMEIIDGVQAGQAVILVGKQTLNDGQAVNPTEAK